jgi:glc operon protein GlcG
MKHLIASMLVLLLAARGLHAEDPPTSSRPALTLAGAERIAAAAIDYARAHDAPGGAIAIVDAAGSLMLLKRLDGTFTAAPAIATGKARTAAAFGKPTRVFEEAVNNGRTTMVTLPDVIPFTPLQGGVPVLIDGHTAGAVGVSGAASAQQDDDIAQAAVDAFGAHAASAAPAVSHFDRDTVAAAFRDNGALLATAGYKVNASRRDGPGEAEIHLTDTDIFYVIEGSATFVTGGDVVDPRTVAPGEVRGSAIRNGESRAIGQGEVIIVPRGIPHWFREVRGPFIYYVVKSSS